jgi:hypothetical protein
MSRLTGRGSKDKLYITDGGATAEDPIITINRIETTQNGGQEQSTVKDKHKDSGLGSSKSKRGKEKKEEKKGGRSKSRDPGDNVEKTKGKGKEKEKNRPDRECVVM